MQKACFEPPRHRLHTLLAVCGLVAAALCVPAHAQWKWKDKDGRVTVSDRPPPRDVADKDIVSRPPQAPARATGLAAAGGTTAGPAAANGTAAPAPAPAAAASAAPAPKTALEREVEARKRAAEEEKAAKAKAEEEKAASRRAENCRRARQQMASLDSGMRIARVNEKGEREVLDDAGRAAEARRTREVIDSDCR